MKKTIYNRLIIFLSFLLVTSVTAQETEGWIKYKVSFKSPMPQLVSHEDYLILLAQEMGDLSNSHTMYYFTPNQYASEMVLGKNVEYLTYDASTKKVYNWEKNSKTAKLFDTKVPEDDLIDIIQNPGIDTILGIPCKSIIIKTSDTYQIAWYNEEYFPIDPEVYKDHQFGHYADLLRITKSIPVKYEIKNSMMHFIQTIEEYHIGPNDPSIFEVPKFKKLLDGLAESKKNMLPK